MMRYITYLLAYLVLQVVAYLITPLLPLFAKPRFGYIDNANKTANEPRLPDWLSWFMTPDNSLYGDNGWKESHYYTRYYSMVAWLYRNSLYGFKWSVLACPVTQPNMISYQGDPAINRNNGITGVFRAQYGDCWQWKCVKKLIGDWGIMWNFGWQLDEFVKSGQPGDALFQFSPRFVKIK